MSDGSSSPSAQLYLEQSQSQKLSYDNRYITDLPKHIESLKITVLGIYDSQLQRKPFGAESPYLCSYRIAYPSAPFVCDLTSKRMETQTLIKDQIRPSAIRDNQQEIVSFEVQAGEIFKSGSKGLVPHDRYIIEISLITRPPLPPNAKDWPPFPLDPKSLFHKVIDSGEILSSELELRSFTHKLHSDEQDIALVVGHGKLAEKSSYLLRIRITFKIRCDLSRGCSSGKG